MKYWSVIYCSLFFSFSGYSQHKKSVEEGLTNSPQVASTQKTKTEVFQDNQIYEMVEVRPSFEPNFNINKFISDQIRYPDEAIENEVEGRVIVTFVVEKDGSISNINIESKPLGSGLEREAKRVVKLLPKLNPAKMNGKPVRSKFRLPILFKLVT